ncbi:MAG: trehalose synthase [Acidimicrobiaceae bacterium]|nr:trehalose synthase [Acidimicrobiaceae bacterium]
MTAGEAVPPSGLWSPGGSGPASSGHLVLPGTGLVPGPVEGWRPLSDDPRWYERAVFYEVVPRGFYDSNGDGIGDLAGVVEKLDYLAWLGVDCLWLLPYYPSPLRDGGYDVSDYYSIAPECGTVDDLARLIEEAHRRGIRVIADLVINHTSDEHAWFQESRSSRDNPKADWYVWSDDDQAMSDIRVIFCDTESSNWTWDSVRQQFYWHRFFHHQPDLNYENPEVREAIMQVVRFWLDLGLDGFRLDAAAYLYQREGTTGENLPETHAFLQRMRKEIDRDYPNRMLLAEVNQWPLDVIDYFGQGDECNMCFHFPLMPRMFMAVRREQRFPITEILAQTPPVPEGAQWGIFLRNHDELTLEMVSEDERDYMYAEYASDPRMRKNLGIRRRLAPLVENDRRVAELLHGLLLSLPGSPVLYYGDELLMGDNIYLGDRDGVRTPMQWTPDRNGGFSRADFAQLFLPPSMDPVYGFQSVNVEAGLRDQSSFLHWLHRMLGIRRQYPVFAKGELEVVPADNPSILAYVRSAAPAGGIPLGAGPSAEAGAPPDNRAVLCVNNLSRFAQSAEISLGRFEGYAPVELVGRTTFPVVGSSGYSMSLGPHGFYWLELQGG